MRSKFVVFCGNAWLGATAPPLQPKIMRISTYIVATEPLGEERAQRLITDNAAVADMNWIIDYFRRSADHRLLFGGRVNYSGIGSFDAPSATRKRMLGVFPQLADVKIEYSWGGDLDITLNRAPHFGRLAPNVYFLQGFSGHGIVLTGIAGKLVAEAVAGTAERFDVFTKIPHARFRAGWRCAGRHWCWQCSITGLGMCFEPTGSGDSSSRRRSLKPWQDQGGSRLGNQSAVAQGVISGRGNLTAVDARIALEIVRQCCRR